MLIMHHQIGGGYGLICDYDTLPHVDHWCMVGDFNMIEDKLDRSGGREAVLYVLYREPQDAGAQYSYNSFLQSGHKQGIKFLLIFSKL